MSNEHICKTCIENEDGFCDKKGILVTDDDTCTKWKEDWRKRIVERFTKVI